MPPVSEFPISGAGADRKEIVFDATKDELVKLNDGYKTLQRKLKSTWKLTSNHEVISPEPLSLAMVYVISGPQAKFTAEEFNALKSYMSSGGSLLITLGEGGEKKLDTNVNFFLEEFGIAVNNDVAVRTNYHKYFHPKEALISNGLLNRAVAVAAGKEGSTVGGILAEDTLDQQSLAFVYPFGSTLNVQSPAIPILSTGSVSFPPNRPVCAVYYDKSTGGKLAVLGSSHIFADQYIDKEENSKLKDVIFGWLTGSMQINFWNSDAEDPDISDYNQIPDTGMLSNQLRTCLQESDDLPPDFTRLFDNQCYSIDLRLLPASIKAYGQLGLKHEQLKLIAPTFETPLPPLQPAIFPPSFQELPNPSLELFDLDEAFSSEKSRLAQITNKCTEDDLEYFIREAGEILGINAGLPGTARDAKHILEYIFTQIVEFKKINQ
ncbi:unnamed protein product, partial [Cyprideis torosa]